MLTDEQREILPPKAQEHVRDLQQGLTSFSGIFELANMLATALLDLKEAQKQVVILQQLYDDLFERHDDLLCEFDEQYDKSGHSKLAKNLEGE